MHVKLKRVHITGLDLVSPLTPDCLMRLRQRHFPRLKRVAIDGCDYVIPLRAPPPSLAKILLSHFVRSAAALISRIWRRKE
jgi:hypothetical protein